MATITITFDPSTESLASVLAMLTPQLADTPAPDLVPVRSEPAPEAVTAFSSDALLDFLQSDPRYTKRTMKAIEKAFPRTSAYLIQRKVAEMIDSNEVNMYTRHDGVAVYKAA
jgi:hypothetical protein